MSKTWKAAIENDRVASGLFGKYRSAVENVGGSLQPSFSFGVDPTNPTLLILVLPDDVEPVQIFPADLVFVEVETHA